MVDQYLQVSYTADIGTILKHILCWVWIRFSGGYECVSIWFRIPQTHLRYEWGYVGFTIMPGRIRSTASEPAWHGCQKNRRWDAHLATSKCDGQSNSSVRGLRDQVAWHPTTRRVPMDSDKSGKIMGVWWNWLSQRTFNPSFRVQVSVPRPYKNTFSAG